MFLFFFFAQFVLCAFTWWVHALFDRYLQESQDAKGCSFWARAKLNSHLYSDQLRSSAFLCLRSLGVNAVCVCARTQRERERESERFSHGVPFLYDWIEISELEPALSPLLNDSGLICHYNIMAIIWWKKMYCILQNCFLSRHLLPRPNYLMERQKCSYGYIYFCVYNFMT